MAITAGVLAAGRKSGSKLEGVRVFAFSERER
jgi:hypothetical protein